MNSITLFDLTIKNSEFDDGGNVNCSEWSREVEEFADGDRKFGVRIDCIRVVLETCFSFSFKIFEFYLFIFQYDTFCFDFFFCFFFW